MQVLTLPISVEGGLARRMTEAHCAAYFAGCRLSTEDDHNKATNRRTQALGCLQPQLLARPINHIALVKRLHVDDKLKA